MIRRPLLIALLLVPALCAVSAESGADAAWPAGEPLRVRNLSPGTLLYGLPRPLGALTPSGAADLSLILEHGNNFTAKAGDGLMAVFDGSTTVAALALRAGFGRHWEWGLEVPLVHHAGGFTDGFIEEFHDLFGFPHGNRQAVPRDRLDYRIAHQGEEVVNVSSAGGHLGDVRAWLGYRMHQSPAREVVVRALVELPTGNVDDLSGSQSTDFSAWMELVDHRWLDNLNVVVTLAGGLTVPGEGELLPERQRDVVGFAHLGLHYPLNPRLTLRAQLDGHSDVIDAGVAPFAEAALLGTLGSTVRLSPSLALNLGLVEDLTPHRAPDVVFFLSLGARL